MFMKRSLALAAAALLAVHGLAQERGTPLFQDSFDTPGTFAENWILGEGGGGKVQSTDGRLLFPRDGSLRPRAATPQEFVAEVEMTMDGDAVGKGSCGFQVEGFRFAVTESGGILACSGEAEPQGKAASFAPGRPMKLVLARQADGGVAKYHFTVNGVKAAELSAPLKASTDGKYQPLFIQSDKLGATADNFGLFSLKRAGDSPNLIVNSGFEHAEDGFPPFYSRSGFDLSKWDEVPYSDYLASVSLDSAERHSGRCSLRMEQGEKSGTKSQWIGSWGVKPVKGRTGVFSAWMKADREGLPVTLSCAGGKGQKIVKVGKEWKRYETVRADLPAPGIYSIVGLGFSDKGVLWVDDLQAEIIDTPTAEEIESGKSFATAYMPSVLDKIYFGERTRAKRAPTVAVPKLPAGCQPTDLDSWKDHAAKIDRFYPSCTLDQSTLR